MKIQKSKGYPLIKSWFASSGHAPFSFQEECWQRYADGYSGLVIAPTGFGKTFSVMLAVVLQHLNNPDKITGTQLLWITPLRSLAKDLGRAMQQAVDELGLDWQVGIRNGDTEQKEKLRQKKQMPQILIITPESLHLLFAQKGNAELLKSIQCVAVDEWHELLGNKRGVLVELALGRLKRICSGLRIWGLSATIGNIDQALEVLVPNEGTKKIIVRATQKKVTEIHSILPEQVETLPWAGHMGLKMADQLVPIIQQSRSTLVFTNTRNQAETWYQTLLKVHPDFAGQLALHHGSVDGALRQWIEEALHRGQLKAVVCTSSLDLGVDFKPVDTVVQIGSPKGVARFLQRAGRSGHSPFLPSLIYFMPTHSLELVEAAALKVAAANDIIEARIPLVLTYDVLVQYLVTLAVGEGLDEMIAYEEIKETHAFAAIEQAEWQWVVSFILTGGEALQAYDDFQKVEWKDGVWRVTNRRMAMRHRLQIGVIVSDAMLKVRFMGGGYVGMIEEYFASRLIPGDTFILSGRVLEFVGIKEMTAIVRASKAKNARAPSWKGGRLPLSSNLTQVLRNQFTKVLDGSEQEPELEILRPLFQRQQEDSHIPAADELLAEYITTKEGYHLFVYPFEGRLVHEVLGALVAFRISKKMPISFSIAMNDYGFELFSDSPFELDEQMLREVLQLEDVLTDLQGSINATEMASRKFRDIATIAGLVFNGYPGHYKTNKNLQASAGILFKVFEEYDKGNLLVRQAYEEVYAQQLEDARLMDALQRIEASKIILVRCSRYTPLSFPIKVDSMRDSVSSEKLADSIKKMQEAANKKKQKSR